MTADKQSSGKLTFVRHHRFFRLPLLIVILTFLSAIHLAVADDHLKVEKRDIEIPYITKNNDIDRRSIRVHIPETAEKPMPLVFIAHYPLGEDTRDYKEFIQKGWAVATVIDFKGALHNTTLTDDDLVFNSAALSVARKLPEIDRTRVAVTGGSAGGYMTLMLSALHLGICCSVSNAGITNIRFNMFDYFRHAHTFNLKELEKLTEREREDRQRRLEAMPIPVLGSIYDGFIPLLDNFPDANDDVRWAAYSPACLTGCFSNPILQLHFTSDMLVPIDQVTKRFTHENGKTLPEGFKLRLSEFDLPAILQQSLEEAVAAQDLSIRMVPVPNDKNTIVPAFDADRKINIFVLDEGPAEATAGHQKNATGAISFTPYFETYFARSSRLTNELTVEKLALLAERYAGKSIQLPARASTDDTLYGSAARYRAEVLEELLNYMADRGKEDLSEIFRQAGAKRPDLVMTLDELQGLVR